MRKEDFEKIPYITCGEVYAAGGNIAKLEIGLFISFSNFRVDLGEEILLTPGGLNSGIHSKDSYHYKNIAIDWYLKGRLTGALFFKILMLAGKHCFNGVGVYKNHETGWIGFHFDKRQNFTLWYGEKEKTIDKWIYKDLAAEILSMELGL